MSQKKSGRVITTPMAAAVLIVGLVVGLAGGYFLAPYIQTTPKLSGVLKIGVALPLTGDLATYGQNGQTALALGKSQINALLSSSSAGYSIDLIVQDTQTKPDVALTVTQDLVSKGCQVILGYYSSGELRNCMSYAQTNRIILVSPSSTALSLQIDKPYIYRFCPADDKQGPAIARALVDLGISYIIPIWRGDTYGDGLEQSTTTRFQALGGSYDTSGIRYDISATEFSSQVGILADKVQTAVNQYGASKVGVFAVTFEEIASIMDSANSYSVLSQVKWFGCDGQALSAKVTDDTTAAGFAKTTMFPSSYFAPPSSAIQTQVNDYVKGQLGHIPDPYAYGLYDALWVTVKSMALTQQYNGAAINKVFSDVAKMTYGASGWLVLDKYGDRTIGDYQFWQVYLTGSGKYDWYLSGYYSAATDSVVWYAAP